MESLFSALKREYEYVCSEILYNSSFIPFIELINDGNNCAAFIREVLKDDDINQTDETSTYYEFAKERSIHAVLTYLVGLLFFDFHFLEHKITEAFISTYSFQKDDVYRLWMLTALYHDWGYTSKNVEKTDFQFHGTYDLLTDSYFDESSKALKIALNNYSIYYPKAFAHTYDQIKAYDRCSRVYHKSKNKGNKKKEPSSKPIEMIDHGILGGVTIFDRLIRNCLKNKAPSEKEILMAKTSCITIAQHNIFKSNTAKRDDEYKEWCGNDDLAYLYHDKGFSVGISTPLLFLLSLVDTFECIKRFGKSEIGAGSMQARTILSRIDIQVTTDTISFDYSKLLEFIQKEKEANVKDAFKKYIENSIVGLAGWTELKATPLDTDPIHTRFELTLTRNSIESEHVAIS